MIDPRLRTIADAQPFPLLFATVSGAHLYGFPSPDSDWDLRGVHVLPWREVAGLVHGPETLETARMTDGLDLDLVTHDAGKFFRLMLRKNGYVLEQLHSPLVVVTTPEHAELRELAAGCVTRHHWQHYRGFFETQWHLLEKEQPPRVKPLLYAYRVLLTGIHLMRTGKIEANVVTLNADARLSWIDELVARKTTGAEDQSLSVAELAFHERETAKLRVQLEEEAQRSSLPELPTVRDALHALLVRLRARG